MEVAEKKKILIIEDEEALAHMMRLRLEKSGYEVILAYDGEEGLKKAQEEKPDLILLDFILPIVDGMTVCKTLKTNPDTKGIFIIFVSAIEKKVLSEKSALAGADGFILKPLVAKDLLKKITDLVG